MTSRIAFDAWQLLFPAIGIAIFAAIFLGAVFRVCRMKTPRLRHLENLPLEAESPRRAAASLSPAGPGATTPAATLR